MNAASNCDDLGYRPCVGIMVLNADNHIWLGRRSEWADDPEGPGAWWQMPQGGIDEGEDPRAAGLRELHEETGIKADPAAVIAESAGWLTYDLPPPLVGKVWKGRYRGQKMKWLAVRYAGPDAGINITPPPGLDHKAEFDAWRWASASELMDVIVPFKRDVYEQVLAEFAHLVR